MKRDEKNKQTYSLIIKSSLEIFSQYGYENSTISQITKHAGISKGIIYHYFINKDELYIKCLEDFIVKLVAYSEENLSEKVDYNTFTDIRRDFLLLHPNLSQILNYIVLETPAHLKEDIIQIKKPLREMNMKIYTRILENMSLGKGIKSEDAIKYFDALQYAVPMIFEVYNGENYHLKRFLKIFFNGLSTDITD